MLWKLILFSPILTLLIATISIKYNLLLQNWIKQKVYDKFGLTQLDEFSVSYDRNRGPPFILHIKGIQLRVKTKQQQQQAPTTNESSNNKGLMMMMARRLVVSTLSQRIPKVIIQFLLDIPIHLLMTGLANSIALHIDDLQMITRDDDNLCLQIDHIYIDSKSVTRLFQEKLFAIGVQIGPFHLATVAQSSKRVFVVEMTTACLVTMSFHFKASRLSLKDSSLDIQLGKMNLDMNACSELVSNNKKKTSTQFTATSTKGGLFWWQKQENLNSIRVTAQSIRFIATTVSSLTPILLEVHQIQSTITFPPPPRHNSNSTTSRIPVIQINTELIQCTVILIALFTMPSMEIKLSPQSDQSSNNNHVAAVISPPQTTEFISVTWILNSPMLTIPFNNIELMNVLLISLNKSTSDDNSNQQLEKVVSDLPMCTFALVLNSPRLELPQVVDENRCGYITTTSLILRVSGEYLVQERSGSSSNDVPSSSSSSGSSSNLDTLFAQEEYLWLNNNKSTQQQQRRNNATATSLATRRLANLMGRVSRRRQPPDQQIEATRRVVNKEAARWTYRISAKIILHRFDLGYMEENDKSSRQFVGVKNAVLVFKSRMNVVFNNCQMRYETVFSSSNLVQSEVSIDKPVIYICDDQSLISASVFWIQSVPQCISNIKSKQQQPTATAVKRAAPVPAWINIVMRNTSFSLEVNHGKIIATCLDSSHQDEGPTPPLGYIDNTPTETVFVQLVFETQKFNFVCEGPAVSTSSISDSECWKSRCHMEKLYIQQASKTMVTNIEELQEQEQHVVLWNSQLNLTANYHHAQKQLTITTKIKKYGISYSIRNHYTLLLLVKSFLTIKSQVKGFNRDVEDQVATVGNTFSLPPPSFSLDLNVHIGRGDLRICLPQSTHLYLRIDDFSLAYQASAHPHIKVRNLMLLGESTQHAESWEQIVEIDKTQITIKKDFTVELKARKILATIPYNYILAAVIENVIGLVKAIKELHSRILSRNAFTFFGPSMKNNPILIPSIQIRAKVFTIHFDDDPFEARLRNILRTGLVEQQKRLAYREALDDKIQDMLATAAATATSSTAPSTTTATSDSSSLRQQQEFILLDENAIFVASPSPDLDWIHSQIMDANKNLLEYYSEFWIKNINETLSQEFDFYQALHSRDHYRSATTSETIDQALDELHLPESNHFIIDIQPRPCHPPLANFSAQFAKVSFRPADFALGDTRQFIHEIGGGVPLDNPFSIIIPFHLSIKAGKTWIKIRDYPLPLLYVPNDDERQKVAWTLEGNYALGDEFGNSGGSRIIPIPIIPPTASGSLGYCLSAVRTASPLKFYSVIDYTVLTKSMSMICWSISYNPAIQDIICVLETLTASLVDPSPSIGFWDKVRLMIHTQTKISFINGGDLAFVVKGTRDPYQLQGRGAGITKVWSDNVVWLLGYKNPQNEFMQIVSKNYAFGVPDLARGRYVPSFPDSLEKKKRQSSTSGEEEEREYGKFLKVALKLSDGIRMGIGMHFERLGCDLAENGVCFKCASAHHLDRCRTQVFSPHYNVLYQSVQQVERFYDKATYDTFAGFRSDFVHLSFSIVKLQTSDLIDSPGFSKDDPYFTLNGVVSQNAMYLSPCFIEHFLNWFRLFGSPISLPIRQGKLFPRDQGKSKSLGDHLNTIKYKIVINPLAIGFFCTDEETYLNVKGGGAAGLKARVNAFSVDLHSRKERVISPEKKAKTESKFHELEVELHDIDLRAIKLTHLQSTKSTAAADGGGISTAPTAYSEGMSLEEYEEKDDESTRSYSFQWVDPKDYIILDSVPHMQHNRPKRKIEVHPFAFSPLFYYVKQNDEAGTEKREYLRGTHDCIMGKGMDSHEFQKTHLNRRASDLDKIIENHDKQLDVILNALNYLQKHHDHETLNEQYNLLTEKLDYLRTNRYMLHTYIAQLILENELNMTESSPNRDSPHTTTSSRGRHDELSRWEMLMGHFTDRFFIHNPQIIWNNSVRDAIYYWQDIKNTRSVQDYNLSARCLKFLEDLVHTAEKQQQWKPDVPATTTNINAFSNTQIRTDDDDIDMDKNITQTLIEKLLSERTHNFVAYNEKEEDKSKAQQQQNYEGIYVFEDNNSQNANDPDYQYKNIPESYEMKSKYLIDMINPQVNFQSEKGLNHLILLTNERIHIKAFGIIDNSSSDAADKDVRLVKDRIIVSLDNAQLLVAKRMEFLSFDLLTQSCYGQCRNKHWAAWVHPEQLWYYKDMKYFDNFQRVASQLSGTIQLDRYNHLRIKIDKYNTSSRKSPFEDRTNTMQLFFPQFKVTFNSLQGHVLYYTLINLLLGNDGSRRKKERLDRAKDVMLAAERSDLAETVRQVGILQNRSRVLLDMHKRLMNELPYLDTLGMREFNRNKKLMCDNLEKLYFVVEAIRSIQTFRRDIHLEETDSAMRFSFASNEIVWEALMEDQSSLCTWTLSNIKFVLLSKPNGSSKNTIEVDRMQIKNTTESPVFTNVLDAYMEPGQRLPDFSRHKMLRGTLESLPPVGGIPVIQHLEINLIPLNLQISTAFGTAMKDYFFPRVMDRAVPQEDAVNEQNQMEEEKYEEDEEEFDDVQEEETTMDGLKVTSRSSSKSDLLSLGGNSLADKSSLFSKREGSFASFDMLTQKVKQSVTRKPKAKSDELTIMKNRSSTNRTFIYVRIPATTHCLSLQGPSQRTLYNLYNFPFKQPKLEYRNKTWSMAEMMEEIQKQFVRAILRHSPALIKSKFITGNKQQMTSISTPSTAAAMTSSALTTMTPTEYSKRKVRTDSSASSSSNIDLMDDSVIYNRNDNSTEAETTASSYQTEEEDVQNDSDDIKSLYSEDPEDMQERLIELQVLGKRISINVDKEIVDYYMKKYKGEDEVDELVKKGRILFGDSYSGSLYNNSSSAAE